MKARLAGLLVLSAVAPLAMGADCLSAIYGINPTSSQFTASFSGDQEVPPIASSGTGTGAFSLNGDESQLTYNVTASGLSGPVTAAHFHFSVSGAAASGPVAFGISDDVSETDGQVLIEGVWNLTAEDVINLRLNYLYVNLHTAQNPSGEIRGNIVPTE
jgi:hypothetical protein